MPISYISYLISIVGRAISFYVGGLGFDSHPCLAESLEPFQSLMAFSVKNNIVMKDSSRRKLI